MVAFNVYFILHLSLFKFILQQLYEFQIDIQRPLTKLSVFKVSIGHPSKVAKWQIMASGTVNSEYLNRP